MKRKLVSFSYNFWGDGKYYVSFSYYDEKDGRYCGVSESVRFTEKELYQILRTKLKRETAKGM